MKIGFIGLGIMGSRMAQNLLNNDVSLVVHNRTAAAAAALLAAGAEWAERPCDTAEVDILFTMLAHPQAVADMALGDDGFLDALHEGALWVDCSTVHPRFAREMTAAAAEHDVRYIDAPVAGTKPQAQDAQLVFLAGAHDADLAECRPYMEKMGRQVVHVGPPGMGTSLKVVVNNMLALSMAAFAESMALGQTLGLDEAMLQNVLVGSPVTAPVVGIKKGIIDEGLYDPQFPLQWMHKDLLMVEDAALENELVMPLSEAAKGVYGQAVKEGLGELDFSAIYHFYNPDSGSGE